MSRFDFLPSYHYEVNTDGIINNPAVKELRGCKIYGADGGVGDLNKNIAKIEDWDKYKWLAGTIKDIEPETGSFVISAQYGMYYVPLTKLMPDIEADKEYYLFATAPQAKNQFVYLYGEPRSWKFGTKTTITQADIDSANGMSIYGAADGSDTQYTGFMVVPAEMYDAEQTEFEPCMTPGKYNIPITVNENLVDMSKITGGRKLNGYVSDAAVNTRCTMTDGVVLIRYGAYASGVVFYDTLMSLPSGKYILSADCYLDMEDETYLEVRMALAQYSVGDYSKYTVKGTFTFLNECQKWQRLSAECELTEDCEAAICIQPVGDKNNYLNVPLKVKNIRLEPISKTKTTYIEIDKPLYAGESINVSGIEVPNKMNAITVGTVNQPSAVEYEYYTY